MHITNTTIYYAYLGNRPAPSCENTFLICTGAYKSRTNLLPTLQKVSLNSLQYSGHMS